jgi:copper homeostasis protein
MILLEVCVASVADARAAQAGGASRLELNTGLALGGLTPTRGLLRAVKAASTLPVVAMLRPRPGGCAYDDDEFAVMRRDLDDLLAEDVAGVAVGVLLPGGRVDRARTAELVRQAGAVPVVFHRAFDLTPDPFAALEELIDLGVRRVLTSGQEVTAAQGSATLRELIEKASGRIEILPGGGINRFTVAEVVTRTGCTQVHASLRSPREENSASARPHINFGATTLSSEDRIDGTDADLVAGLVRSLAELGGTL